MTFDLWQFQNLETGHMTAMWPRQSDLGSRDQAGNLSFWIGQTSGSGTTNAQMQTAQIKDRVKE